MIEMRVYAHMNFLYIEFLKSGFTHKNNYKRQQRFVTQNKQ